LRGVFRPLFGPGAVALDIEDPIGVEMMCSDEGKVSQILRNLVSNAMKFTERGEVRVRAEAGPDMTVVFTVSDTGIGIAPENLGAIFDDFTQIESNVQRRVRGTGLGLPLTRKLARLLGGEVSVTSTLGQGSVFTVKLPLACPPGQEDAEPVSEANQMAARSG
jgi:signal transduction histidine kinase